MLAQNRLPLCLALLAQVMISDLVGQTTTSTPRVLSARLRWTDAVVRELRSARYQPARRGRQNVRQWVQQLFTYYNDGRPHGSR
jgi:hypothetical protein